MREFSFSTEQNHKEESVWRNKRPRSRTVSFAADRLLTWSTITSGSLGPWFRRELCRPIYYGSSKWWYSGIRFEMRWKFIINDEKPTWWHLGRTVHIKNTRVWETQDCIGIVRLGDSSKEEVRTWLSQIKKLWWREVSSRKFEIRVLGAEMEILRRAPWSRIREQNSVYTEFLEIVGNVKSTGNVLKETIAVSATILISVGKVTQPNPSPSSFIQQNERNASRTWRARGRSSSGRRSRWPCKDYLKGNCTKFIRWIVASSRMFVLQVRKWMQICGKVLISHIVRLMNSRAQGPKRMMTKVQWLCWKLHDKWGLRISKCGAAEVYQRFWGWAQIYGKQSDVFNSQMPSYVMLIFTIKNQRNENLLSTPERECTWSAKRTWILLKWILWRNRAVLW